MGYFCELKVWLMFCCCDWNIVCNIMALFRVIMAPHFIWIFCIHLYALIYGFDSYFETLIQCNNVNVFINPYSFEFRMLPVSHMIWLANSFDVFYIESNGTQWTECDFECFVIWNVNKNVPACQHISNRLTLVYCLSIKGHAWIIQ